MKRVFAMGLMFFLCFSVSIYSGGKKSSSGTKKETYEIKLGHVLATDHFTNVLLVQMADKVRERTEGGVDIQVYPNGELSSYTDGVEAVISGAAYLFYSSPGQFSDYCPGFPALQAPFLTNTMEEYSALMDSEAIAKMKTAAEAEGIYVLSLNLVSGYRNLLSGDAVNSVEDINGLKIRVPGNKVWTVPFEMMGTNPSSINWSETYTALQQGVVDAIEGTSVNIYNGKMYEVKNVVTETGHIIDSSGLFISSKYWMALPEEYQQIISEEVQAIEDLHSERAMASEESFKEMLIAEGVAFNTVDKSSFREATQSVILGYDIGQELLNAMENIRG